MTHSISLLQLSWIFSKFSKDILKNIASFCTLNTLELTSYVHYAKAVIDKNVSVTILTEIFKALNLNGVIPYLTVDASYTIYSDNDVLDPLVLNTMLNQLTQLTQLAKIEQILILCGISQQVASIDSVTASIINKGVTVGELKTIFKILGLDIFISQFKPNDILIKRVKFINLLNIMNHYPEGRKVIHEKFLDCEISEVINGGYQKLLQIVNSTPLEKIISAFNEKNISHLVPLLTKELICTMAKSHNNTGNIDEKVCSDKIKLISIFNKLPSVKKNAILLCCDIVHHDMTNFISPFDAVMSIVTKGVTYYKLAQIFKICGVDNLVGDLAALAALGDIPLDLLYKPATSYEISEKNSEEITKEITKVKLIELPPNMMISNDDIECDEQIGNGSFGTVYKGILYNDVGKAQHIAIKKVDVKTMKSKGIMLDEIYHIFNQEASVWSKLNSDHVVKLIGISICEEYLSFIMERMTTSLSDYLSKKREIYKINKNNDRTMLVKLQWAEQISRGIEYFHSQKPPIIHRDLKTANILLTEHCDAKLADFGTTRVLEQTTGILQTVNPTFGTPLWMAPECFFAPNSQTVAVDIYALGVTFLEILDPSYNWIPEDRVSHETRLMRQPPWRPTKPSDMSEHENSFWELITWCWAEVPKDRPTIQNIIETIDILRTCIVVK